VRRGGRSLAQPPSKKTRALLAYLALTGRPHRREALCNLLWDVADDPRGALPRSLSKLRKQLDDERVTRLQTDGERVGIELQGASIDVLEMRSALGQGKLQSAPTDLLETWCARCTGAVLEGLDLPDFDAYQAWLVAERDQTRQLPRLGGSIRRSMPIGCLRTAVQSAVRAGAGARGRRGRTRNDGRRCRARSRCASKKAFAKPFTSLRSLRCSTAASSTRDSASTC